MTLVIDVFNSLIPPRTKKTPSGWLSFNAPCCHNRGHSIDDRQRGGVVYKDGLVYHCFNCGFSTGWKPGNPISQKLRSLVRWMGGSEDDVNRMIFEALKTESSEHKITEFIPSLLFTEKDLPDGAMPISEWINSSELDGHADKLASVVAYLYDRGFDALDNNFYWTPNSGMSDRVIIPFRFNGKIVGNTARKTRAGKPKYVSDQPPNYVFNFDSQTYSQKYVFVTEGPFDALSIGAVGLLHNEISEQQARIINSLGIKPIVIPDQDLSGLEVIDKAVELGWAVAFPTWEDDVKDPADAVRRYGKLFVVVDAIKTAQEGIIKITVAKNQLEAKLKRLEKDD